MDCELIEALKLAKDLVEILDSISTDDISDELSEAIYDSNDVLENLVNILEKEAIGK